MPTINQLVRKPRRPVAYKTKSPVLEGLPVQAGRVPPGQDDDAQEAELRACGKSPACGCPTARKSRPTSAARGTTSRNTRSSSSAAVASATCRASATTSSAACSTRLGVSDRKQARSKYGAPKKAAAPVKGAEEEVSQIRPLIRNSRLLNRDGRPLIRTRPEGVVTDFARSLESRTANLAEYRPPRTPSIMARKFTASKDAAQARPPVRLEARQQVRQLLDARRQEVRGPERLLRRDGADREAAPQRASPWTCSPARWRTSCR